MWYMCLVIISNDFEWTVIVNLEAHKLEMVRIGYVEETDLLLSAMVISLTLSQ